MIKAVKTNRGRGARALSIAAFLAAVIILSGCAPVVDRPMEASNNNSPNTEAVISELSESIKTTSAVRTAKPSPAEFEWKQIYYGNISVLEYSEPRPAENTYYNISEGVSEGNNSSKLFAVRIRYTPFGSLKQMLYSSSPVCSRFLEEYEQWKKDNKLNEFEKPFPKARNFTYDEDDAFMEQFRSIWKEQNSASDWEELCREEKKIQAIRRDYSSRQEYVELCRTLEMMRLDKLGYRIARCGRFPAPVFFLTREQLENFPFAREDDAYRFYWGAQGQYTVPEWEPEGGFIREQMPRPVEFLSALGMLG